jgi:hypothetical protein
VLIIILDYDREQRWVARKTYVAGPNCTFCYTILYSSNQETIMFQIPNELNVQSDYLPPLHQVVSALYDYTYAFKIELLGCRN